MGRLWMLALAPLSAALPPLPRARRAFVLGLCAAASGLALAALGGWLSERILLARWVADLPTMKVNTAVAVLCLSATLAGYGLDAGTRAARWTLLPTLAALLLMAATVAEHLASVDLGVDALLLPPGSTPGAGRTAAAAAVALSLIALAALPGPLGLRRWRVAAAAAAFVIGYVASFGLLLEVPWAQGIGASFADVSLPSAACIVMLSASQWSLLQWQAAEARDEAQASPGARFLRSAMPAAAVLPAAVMWLQHLAHLRGWWDERVGTALAVALLALLLWALALRSARWIDALEAELRQHQRLLERRVDERTAELVDAAARLQASQTQLAAVVQSASTAIITLDERFEIVMFNREAERIFGVTAQEMMGRTLDRLLPERARAAHAQALQRFARTGETLRRMGGEAKLHGLRADGREFPIAASISRIALPQGALLFTVVLRDLGEAQALDEERAARQAAEIASRSKSMLLSHVSHELRTPLNAILGFTQLLRGGADSPAARAEYLDHIENASRQLDALIADLLDLSRAEVGAMVLRPTPVDAAAVLREAAAMIAPQARQRRIELVVDDDEGAATAPVRADRQRLLQVTLNLLGNAVKYTPAGGRVRASLRTADGEVALDVVDSGDGMSDEQLAHLFEPFNRLGREQGRVPGTGIGLALSRQLVLAMGGRIEVASRPGSGSRFTVGLPPAEAPPPHYPAE